MANVTGFWIIFGFGAFGGFIVEVLRWWKIRESVDFPEYSKGIVYWIITVLMIIIGGVIGCLYGLEDRNPASIVQIGASAPAIISALSSKSNNDAIGSLLGNKRGEKVNLLSHIRSFISFR